MHDPQCRCMTHNIKSIVHALVSLLRQFAMKWRIAGVIRSPDRWLLPQLMDRRLEDGRRERKKDGDEGGPPRTSQGGAREAEPGPGFSRYLRPSDGRTELSTYETREWLNGAENGPGPYGDRPVRRRSVLESLFAFIENPSEEVPQRGVKTVPERFHE